MRKQLYFGLPQGAVTSPVLYNLFTHDQPTGDDVTAALFADDTALRASSRFAKQIMYRIETGTKRYIRYFTKWKIKANSSKFNAIFMTRRRRKQLPHRPLVVEGNNVEWSTTVKYLGVIIDQRLTLKSHHEYSLKKAQKALRMFYSFLSRRSDLSLTNKLLFYKIAIRPIFSYGAPVTCMAAVSNLKQLQTFQNKILRLILDIRWNPDTGRFPMTTAAMHEETGIETVIDHFTKLRLNFGARTVED